MIDSIPTLLTGALIGMAMGLMVKLPVAWLIVRFKQTRLGQNPAVRKSVDAALEKNVSHMVAVLSAPSKTDSQQPEISAKQAFAEIRRVANEGGQETTKGDETELERLQRIAEQGGASAQHMLGRLYYLGTGVSQSYETATHWFRLSAEQGYAPAQFSLGNLYHTGKKGPIDYESAEKWYRLSAEQGYAPAQHNMGNLYYFGHGVSPDYQEAAKWLRFAAEQGIALAQYNLGVMYSTGKGVTPDPKEAAKWLRAAAERGHSLAQYNLGAMYGRGEGVPQNYIYAHMWLSLAASSGDKHSGVARDAVAALMIPEQIADAQKLAAECLKNDYKGCP
ncbi:MAG: sel1 repeat family protein [Pirellulales bacterium]|nr:sel1 repeat family protein [Alphaproteobacteria bacterium]MDA8041142.1 sel1 repeat family protein [Pirellulales bacterium]